MGLQGSSSRSPSNGFIETIKAMGEDDIDQGGGARRTLGYLLATAKWLSPSHALPSVTVEVDGEMLTDGAALVVVANVPVFPGKLVFTGDANPLDGLLDVCVVSGGTKRALLLALLSLLLNGPVGKHRILRRPGRVVRISPAPPRSAALTTGETHSPNPDGWNETLTVLPRSLRCSWLIRSALRNRRRAATRLKSASRGEAVLLDQREDLGGRFGDVGAGAVDRADPGLF
jgi:hypothetical protein